MIRFLHRKDIDEAKWNALVAKHNLGLPYAYTWYLDVVCEIWEGMIYGNYEAVMPLPIAHKWMLKFVYQPDYCQQLGVFSESKNPMIATLFFEALKKKYWFYHVQQNSFFEPDTVPFLFKPKQNLTLSLASPYGSLAKNYSENTKRNLGRARKLGHVFALDDVSVPRFIEIYCQYTPAPKKGKVSKIIQTLGAHQQLHIASVKSEFMEVLAADIVIKTPARLVHLIPVTTTNGRSQSAMHFLIDQLIRQYAETNIMLDFEGSSVESIVRFYKSFGASPEYFFETRKWL